MQKKPFIIAIDGLSASGKGAIASRLAQMLEFAYLDTGKLYRIVAKQIIDEGIHFNDVDKILKEIKLIDFNGFNQTDLHLENISDFASKIAIHQKIRDELNVVQRNFANNQKGAVLDGRDIGTVIFPDANLKFFITASVGVRALRRFKQLQQLTKLVQYDTVLKDLIERDQRDQNRNSAPTMPSDNAIIIDNTYLDISQTVNLIYTLSYKGISNYLDLLN